MLVAAEAWDSLATELYSTANAYESVISGLSAQAWLGPTSMLMAGAAASYVTWLSGTAAQAQQTADQARTAAAAFETAFAATVPPEVVAANRIQLMALIATNVFGQNTPAIAATEALYSEMWAQDSNAMFGYAGSSASATQVAPFTSPPQTTDPAAAGAQAAAATGTAAAGDAQSTLTQLFTSVPNALADLASSSVVGSFSPTDILDVGADIIAFLIDAPMAPIGAISLPIDLVGAQTGLHTDEIVAGWAELAAIPGAETEALSGGVARVLPVAAGVGQANTVGTLSVPPTWTAATPAVRPVALALPTTSIGIDPQAYSTSLGTTVGDLTMAGAAGRALGDRIGGRAGGRAGERVRAAVGSRDAAPVAATTGEETTGTEGQPEQRTVVTGIAAEIREFAKLRDEGLITDEHYVAQRNRLLGL